MTHKVGAAIAYCPISPKQMLEYLLGDNNVELIVKHTGADDILVVVDDNNLKVEHAERVASWIEQRQNLARHSFHRSFFLLKVLRQFRANTRAKPS